MTDTPLDYATAGVDTAAGDRAVELMKSAVAATHDSTVLGATGGFAGMVDASALLGMEKPLLATSTDGVARRLRLRRPWMCTTRSARTWSAWSSTTSS